jgi:hypothetical protein
MAAGTLTLYDAFAKSCADGTIDLDSDTFKVALLTSGYTPSQSHTQYSDLTNEVAAGTGYTTTGQALTNVTWSQTAGVATFTSDFALWTAAGGSITARFAVIYDDTSVNDELVGYMLLVSPAADVTATDTNTFKITPHATQGWFQNMVN